MSTFNFVCVWVFSASLLALFVQIKTSPTEKLELPKNATLSMESWMNSTEENETSELTALATSDLNMTSTYLENTTREGHSHLDVEDILRASVDDDMFSVIIDQSGDGNSTESLEDEALMSEESGSGGGSVGELATATSTFSDDLNSTVQGINGTEEPWSTDTLGSPIPALMFA